MGEEKDGGGGRMKRAQRARLPGEMEARGGRRVWGSGGGGEVARARRARCGGGGGATGKEEEG